MKYDKIYLKWKDKMFEYGVHRILIIIELFFIHKDKTHQQD